MPLPPRWNHMRVCHETLGWNKCLMAVIFTFDLGHGHFDLWKFWFHLNVTSRIRTIVCVNLSSKLSIVIMKMIHLSFIISNWLTCEKVQSAYCSIDFVLFLSSTKLIILIYAVESVHRRSTEKNCDIKRPHLSRFIICLPNVISGSLDFAGTFMPLGRPIP